MTIHEQEKGMIYDLSMHVEQRYNTSIHQMNHSALDVDRTIHGVQAVAYNQIRDDLKGLSESVEFMIINGVEFRRT